MIELKLNETPRRYELSWRSSSRECNSKLCPAIVVCIHPSVASKIPEISNDADQVSTIADNFDFDLDSFTGDVTSNYFGFENALERNRKDSGVVELIGELPTDKDSESLARTTTKTFWPLAASITLLLQILNHFDVESDASLNQLMKVEASFTRDYDDRLICSVGGVYGSALVSWLADQSATKLESVTKAMKGAYRTMIGIKEYEQAEFTTEVRGEQGWLNISCPGDRCGLNPDSSSTERGENTAYEFIGHNVDTPVQMLTLISGLAQLHDMARVELDA